MNRSTGTIGSPGLEISMRFGVDLDHRRNAAHGQILMDQRVGDQFAKRNFRDEPNSLRKASWMTSF
jgi:hypothetical protein